MNADVEELTRLFRNLGASEPELWAFSQAQEGINQLHRYLFLRQAWAMVVPEDDHSWMDAQMAHSIARPDEPFSGTGASLRKLVDSGVDRQLLSDLVRGMQAELLSRLYYMLDDPSIEEAEVAHVGWRLVETDEEFHPTLTPIGGLHESVLETDPTGREMRPRVSSQ